MTFEMLLFYLLITKRKHPKGAYLGIDHYRKTIEWHVQ